jgi:hypothetical protein
MKRRIENFTEHVVLYFLDLVAGNLIATAMATQLILIRFHPISIDI